MKQKNVTKWISLVLFLAVVVYIGMNVFSALTNPFKTTYAVPFETYDYISVSGYLVRDETVVSSPEAIVNITRSEGEKVGSGQTLAVVYQDENAEARQSEISRLNYRLEQLRAAVDSSASKISTTELDSTIAANILDLNTAVASHNMEGINDQSTRLKNLVFSRDYVYNDTGELEEEIDQLQSQLTALEDLAADETTTVAAPIAGIYSAYVDGFESVLTVDSLDTMTTADYEALAPVKNTSAGSIGKLITGSRWYFVTELSSDDAGRLAGTVDVRLTQNEDSALNMDVERVGPEYDGKRIAVLSSDRLMSDTTVYRHQTVDLIFRSYTGLRVPKTAMRIDSDGKTYVFILEGINAKQKYVTIISETGDYYIVEADSSSTNNLWEGDEIIVAGRNLYDGKVVG